MNVLLITADQWRGDCLSALGHPCPRTPSLDALAADGVLFRNHFSQATPCGPARASLLTGMYAMNHRSVTNGTPLDARHSNLALEARRAGVTPYLFGYTDTSIDPRGLAPDDPRLFGYEGLMPGFEPVVELPEHGAAWLDDLARHGGGRPTLDALYGIPLGEPAPFPAERSETAFLTDAALDFLERRQAREPWLLHLTYIKPHPPLVAAAPYHALYGPADVPPPVRAPTPAEEARQHPWLARALARPFGGDWAITLPGGPERLDEATVRRLRAVYCGLITEVDHHVGRLLAALRRRGELDRTLVIVTSDHGEMLGDHWLLGKSGYFPQAFHVPLIVRDPRRRAARGRVVEAFSEHVDLMPTILEWLGLEPPLQCDGRSLLPWLEGETPAGWRDAAHYEHDFREIRGGGIGDELGLPPDRCALSVRHGPRYSYVHFNGLPALCFDRAADPAMLRGIADDPAVAPVVLAEAQALLSWRMEHAERRLTGCRLTPEGLVGRL
ncbi:MAG TPA: alkaline phosphatase family protein [Geminicoccaceae bacterium]|nr:alkaline phosphatase family protein [Geminicoccaceae bacterium]